MEMSNIIDYFVEERFVQHVFQASFMDVFGTLLIVIRTGLIIRY